MNTQQRAAMQMALTTLEELKKNCTIWLESDDAAITALREALAQPQGEWVDLTDDDLMEVLCEMAASNVVNDSVFAKAVIAKFKEKNTPPIVPQGEPVACNPSPTCARHIEGMPVGTPIYAAPVGAEHFLKAIAALREGIATCRAEALEEAAKVCDKISLRFFKDRCDPQQFVSDQCAAAIRGLK